jgi:hypothetical protein
MDSNEFEWFQTKVVNLPKYENWNFDLRLDFYSNSLIFNFLDLNPWIKFQILLWKYSKLDFDVLSDIRVGLGSGKDLCMQCNLANLVWMHYLGKFLKFEI